MNEPLSNLKVLDFSWVVAGPTIGRSLADFGATVIRIETENKVDTARLIGPYYNGVKSNETSALYGNVNAGKLGFSLDLSSKEARNIVFDLVRWADVVIESFSPGVMEKLGLHYERLREINENIIMLSSSLMGGTGPQSKFAGFGNVGSAMSGCMNIAGWEDLPPKGPFGPYTDFVGPRFSLVILLAALEQRKRTGEGCYIDLSQVESGVHFIAQGMLNYFINNEVIERQGNNEPQMAPHGVYPCLNDSSEDQSYIAIAVKNDDQWRDLAFQIGGESLANDPRYTLLQNRIENADIIDQMISDWTSKFKSIELEKRLQSVRVPAHNVANSVDALNDEQLRSQGHFIEIEHPHYQNTVIEASRFSLSDTPAKIPNPAPVYGQDNLFILREILNYSSEQIEQYTNLGILY